MHGQQNVKSTRVVFIMWTVGGNKSLKILALNSCFKISNIDRKSYLGTELNWIGFNPCLIEKGWHCWELTVEDLFFKGEENDARKSIMICNPCPKGHVALMGERRDVYRVLMGKPERKRPLGRPRPRWEYNIKTDLHEVVCGVWTGSSCLRIGTGGGNLWLR